MRICPRLNESHFSRGSSKMNQINFRTLGGTDRKAPCESSANQFANMLAANTYIRLVVSPKHLTKWIGMHFFGSRRSTFGKH